MPLLSTKHLFNRRCDTVFELPTGILLRGDGGIFMCDLPGWLILFRIWGFRCLGLMCRGLVFRVCGDCLQELSCWSIPSKLNKVELSTFEPGKVSLKFCGQKHHPGICLSYIAQKRLLGQGPGLRT